MYNRGRYNIAVAGCGNLSFRLSIALKSAGHSLSVVYGRDIREAEKLVYILNKPEVTGEGRFNTKATDDLKGLKDAEIILIAVSDNAIEEISSALNEELSKINKYPVILHCSGATSVNILNIWPQYGVFYPLMTLSKTKPVDFKLIPFFLEANKSEVIDILISLSFSLGSEYKICNSQERLKVHTAAVFVSNFVNYLTGLAYDIAGNNQMFLMPLAIETVRKAFLYEHPSIVQTGPAVRDDKETMKKHLEMIKDMEDHKEVYEMISKLILKQRK